MAITKIKIDGVVYEIESAAPTIITFTIDSDSYEAEEGMTFQQWVNSSYNTGGYIIEANFLLTGGGAPVVYNGGNIRGTDTIIANASYTYDTSEFE